MQYKIPIQIENEDTIVLGLSLRQLGIMMAFGGVAYALYQSLLPQIGSIALVPAIIIAVIGIIIALTKISEMTFLPLTLNYIRMTLNGTERPWSQGTDSYMPMEVGFVSEISESTQKKSPQKESFNTTLRENENLAEKLKNL